MDSLRAEGGEMGLSEELEKEFTEVRFEIGELEQVRQILIRVANQISRVKWGKPNPITGIMNALALLRAAETKLK